MDKTKEEIIAKRKEEAKKTDKFRSTSGEFTLYKKDGTPLKKKG